jgi:putative colanic acid biosynthesis acetyltransferase WcaF
MVDLGSFSNTNFYHGRNWFVRALWIVVSFSFFQINFPYPSRFKLCLLRFFGARIGLGVVIRSNLRIKQPWRLFLGDNVWIGEGVWIDNLVDVVIGNNVCISQGAMLLTGNHNYKSKKFDLITGKIILEDGVWIGAKCLVGPNVICNSHSVLSAGSTAFKDLEPFTIYQGNPCLKIRERIFSEKSL